MNTGLQRVETMTGGKGQGDRQRLGQLKSWCFENRISQAEIARRLQVSKATITLAFQGVVATPALLDRLTTDIGIPRELLPEPTGRKAANE